MKRHTLSLSMLGFALAFMVFAGPASALPQRTFVSPDGNDANPCSLASPCRTLQIAVGAVASAGDVIVLGSAGYGPVVISKSVSIIAPAGVYGGISVASGDGILITGLAQSVVLRGLTLNGGGTAGRGIYFGTGTVLHVEDCVISDFTSEGILALSSSDSQTFVRDSSVRNTDTGIAIGHGSATIDNVRAENNRMGMRVDTGATATIRNSVASGNSDTGFFAFTGVGSQARLNLENCMASNNATGIQERFSVAVISNCVATGNTTAGVSALGGLVYSRQNNSVYGNTLDVDATITALPGI